MYSYGCIQTHTRQTHTYIYTYTHTYTTYTHTYIPTYIHTRQTDIHTRQTHIHTRQTHTYIHTYIHTYTTDMHTHPWQHVALGPDPLVAGRLGLAILPHLRGMHGCAVVCLSRGVFILVGIWGDG